MNCRTCCRKKLTRARPKKHTRRRLRCQYVSKAHTVKHIVQAPENHGSKKKCITGLWDLNIPSDLLQEILSRLGLKANIQASVVCKTWCEAAVSVRKRKLQPPLPWLFYLKRGNYILFDPSRSQTYYQTFPELKGSEISCSKDKDGWLLVSSASYSKPVFFFNPFTRERINLPKWSVSFLGNQLSFSAAPTSSSCLVISLISYSDQKSVISSWRPGETVWKTHRFRTRRRRGMWTKCVFSNDVLYCLSTRGYLSVFDPSRETWTILPVKPWSCFTLGRQVLMMENEGDIFVIVLNHDDNNKPSVFKLNFKRMVWEEKRDVGGLTIFASYPGSFIRASLSAKERNKMYLSAKEPLSVHYTLGDEESSGLPTNTYFSKRIAWVDPPHNNVIL